MSTLSCYAVEQEGCALDEFDEDQLAQGIAVHSMRTQGMLSGHATAAQLELAVELEIRQERNFDSPRWRVLM